ncbi:putative ricin B-like lectin [Helianthus annuus]|nr:putative ricin B-like lectin [Helianthus annuus]
MGLVPHRLYGQPMWGLYTKWAPSPTRLVFWVVFSCLATGEALNHAIGVKYPVKLREYNPNVVEKSVLWSMGRNLGDGYRAVRAADNIHLNLTAHDTDLYDTDIVFWKWDSTDNQMWTIASYCRRRLRMMKCGRIWWD